MTLAERRRRLLEKHGLGPRPHGGKRRGSGRKPALRECAKCGRMIGGREARTACPHRG